MIWVLTPASYTYNKASVNSTDKTVMMKLLHHHRRDKLQGKSSAPQALWCYPPSLKYSADAIYFGEWLSYMAERLLLRAIIIELKWSLEADTLPQWSRSADPVLDGSKKIEMKAGCQKTA